MDIKVIVADDFPLVREGIAQALELDPDISVIAQTETGPQTVELTLRLRPHVLVTDLRMPEMGGLAIMNRLRDQLPELKVVILTATEDIGPLLDAVSAGAQGYLHKRATAEELRHAVITAHGGGSVVSPDLARHLMAEFSSRTRGVSGNRARPAMADREVEVLRLVVQGKTDVEIGNALYISPRTVQNHLTRIREKTGLRRRSELTRWAVEQSFV